MAPSASAPVVPTAPRRPRRRRRREVVTTASGQPWPRVEGPAEHPDWTITTDWRHNGRHVTPGTELSFKRERGRFRFIKHVRTDQGVEWVDVWGGTKRYECFRSFRPERIRAVHRLNRTGRNLAAERKAARAA